MFVLYFLLYRYTGSINKRYKISQYLQNRIKEMFYDGKKTKEIKELLSSSYEELSISTIYNRAIKLPMIGHIYVPVVSWI